jgi:hypothetical protein
VVGVECGCPFSASRGAGVGTSLGTVKGVSLDPETDVAGVENDTSVGALDGVSTDPFSL